MIENGMVVSQNRYDPQFSPDRIAEGMLAECDRLNRYIRDVPYELEDARKFLRTARFVDFELKGEVLSGYEEKLSRAKGGLSAIRQNLILRGYDYP